MKTARHIQENIPLKAFNTFGVEAMAKCFVRITDEKTLGELYAEGVFGRPFFVLGGGSNVLFTEDFPGTIVQMSIRGIQHFIEGSDIYITGAGGENWNGFVWHCVDRGFAGLENMALIPGTVGASPVQNIGAYGAELMDVFYSCRAFDTLTGNFRTFQKPDCGFTYRDSIFKSRCKNRFVITSVTYKLSVNGRVDTSYGAIRAELQKRGIQCPGIRDVAEAVSHIRAEKLPDPSIVGNAGSFFKNPIVSRSRFEDLQGRFPGIVSYPLGENGVKLAAGWLIESCGWKGKTDGRVAVWKNQALVLVNPGGNASGREIFDTSRKIVDDVRKKFGIELEREVNVL